MFNKMFVTIINIHKGSTLLVQNNTVRNIR